MLNQYERDQIALAEHDRNTAKGPDLNRSDGEIRTCVCGWTGQPSWAKTSHETIAEWCPECERVL